MPIFGNKFSPKKGAARKSPSLSNLNLDASETQTEFGPDCGPIKLRLGGQEMQFNGGEWVSEAVSGGASSKDTLRMRKENQQLREENSLLKIKMEILLDMLSERTAELHLQENEVDHLKRLVKKR